MIAKILGIIDILNAIIAIFAIYMPRFTIYFVGLLFIKGLIFGILGDVGSWFDVAFSIIIFLAIFNLIYSIAILRFIGIVLLIKGISSMF